jgi:hypothetical protein
LLPWSYSFQAFKIKGRDNAAREGSPLPNLPDSYRIIFIKMIESGKENIQKPVNVTNLGKNRKMYELTLRS